MTLILSPAVPSTEFSRFDDRLLADAGLVRNGEAFVANAEDPRLVRVTKPSWLDRLAQMVQPREHRVSIRT